MRDDQATGNVNYKPVDSAVLRLNPPESRRSIRGWANPCGWTERMLTTLEQGVRGGRWHTLIDKVYAPLNLFAASRKVTGNQGAAGVDHQTVEKLSLHNSYQGTGQAARLPADG